MKKVTIIAVVIVIAIAGVIFFSFYNKEKNVKNDYGEEDLGVEYGLNIKKEDAIYYEREGSSSVERISYIYYGENKECKIWTRYFNCGESKIIEETLSEETKEMILNEIKNSIKLGEIELDKDKIQIEGGEGGSDFTGVQYIDKNTNLGIQPINLVKLNIVKDIYDIL